MKNLKRRWQLGKVRPGDGSALPDYRLWQLFSRSVLFLDLVTPSGETHVYAVDVRHMVDAKTRKQHEDAVGKSPAALYRDGVQIHRSNLPTSFPVPGGVIEVATSAFGLKRIHFVAEDGTERALRPHDRSQEGLRARFDRRFPRTSAVVGAVTLLILLAALVVNVMNGIEALTRAPAIAEYVGRFVSPVDLPTWGTVAGVLSAVERATRLRFNRLIDTVSS
ncbi:hypothetical protein [Amycolatopsis azurea]|uniref:Uncharacterized protein n=1 Tax=Amycolatopsis azurea DSM 43854 TaxID=1238180 RepID=M2NQE3_9PSEU|nr:hypothetical protein [Amycolatopsis azurea]EMD24479.1 hypothetical protein C791_5847 [Amycolatopsis azurea DSM 43854]OOC01135.1 hypothetical protein B0293_39665 [Amycolatopsis azurea DSM 43854]